MDAELRAHKERCDRAFSKMARRLREIIDDENRRRAAGEHIPPADFSDVPVIDEGRENIVIFHGRPPKPAKK